MMISKFDLMLLGAGRGSRLGELGERVPKPLIEVNGEPLLERQLRQLEAQGVRRVVINSAHLADQIERFVSDRDGRIEIDLSREATPLGTAGGVLNALSMFNSETVIVLCSDVLYPPIVNELKSEHDISGAPIMISCYRSNYVGGKGVVIADDSGRVREFIEKPDPSEHNGERLINGGAYAFDSEWLRGELTEFDSHGEPLDWGRHVFPQALSRGFEIAVFELPGPVLDIGTPESLALANSRG